MLVWTPWMCALATSAEAPDRWRDTVDAVTPGIVSVRMDRPRAFEGKGRSNSYATGFVIDASTGLILTNRHVVTPGPTVAKAVFLDREEVDLVPIYRDPVHDFGLFRYNPADLQHTEAPSLKLRPDKAKVGVEVRVIGNDSGEQISILDGTLARLDRDAPSYGSDFNDFNTFYIQAATGTSGGSSGSPVVDVDGDVVALNAGGKTRAASSFYLPLDRVVRAVELIEAGRPVSRGTLQARWAYTPFDELGRLGLSEATEDAARAANPGGVGLMVLRDVLPMGPAAEAGLRVGDVLVEVDGTPIFDFITIEGILDEAVGEAVAIVVERAGERVEASPTVGDLHDAIPDRYLEVGGAVLHDLSYHQARVMQVPLVGVYVADDGFTFERDGVPRKAIVIEADGVPVPDLEAMRDHLAGVPHGAPVNFRWYAQGKPRQLNQTAVRMDRSWFPARLCTRDDTDGTWPCEDLPSAQPAPPRAVPAASLPPVDDKRGKLLVSSLVQVECDVPYQVAGLPADNYFGGGLVVDADKGWVVVDRDTVPVALGELTITVAGLVRVPAWPIALHPVHSLAVIGYDPATVAGLGLTSAVFAEDEVEEGDKTWFVGLERDAEVNVRETTVRGTGPVGLRSEGPPRFRQTNADAIEVDPSPKTNGVLVDKKGQVVGFQASMSYTSSRETRATMRMLPAALVQETIALANGSTRARSLEWELGVLPLPRALERGLAPAHAERLLAHDPDRRGVLQVVRVVRGSGSDGPVKTGDLVLAVDGQPVSRFRHIDLAVEGRDRVMLSLVRNGEELQVEVDTAPLVAVDVHRVVLWAGVRLHSPHRSARLHGVVPGRPYVAWWDGGSPAGSAKVYPQRSVMRVDGVDTPDLDSFLAAVRGKGRGTAVRLELETKDGETEVVTVEPDERFWPTEELILVDGRWERRPVE